MIPMVDLKGQYQTLKEEIEQGFQETLQNTSFILGPNVQAFEKEAADYLGVKHAIGVASGTDALHLALDAAGIGEEISSMLERLESGEPVVMKLSRKNQPHEIARAVFVVDDHEVVAGVGDHLRGHRAVGDQPAAEVLLAGAHVDAP